MRIDEPWRTFITVVEEGSISGAAVRLRMSQPAVSQHIKQLEAAYGAPLFVRRHRGVALTHSGLIAQEAAEAILRAVHDSLQGVKEAVSGLAGTLAIGASMTIAEYLVPQALIAFRRERPRARIHLSTGNTEEIAQALTAERLLVGLVEGPLYDTRIHQEAILDDQLGAILPSRHSLARRESVSFRELTGDRLLVREPGSGTRTVLEYALERDGLSLRDFTVYAEANNPQTLKSLVSLGYGISIMSMWAVREEIESGALVFVPIDNPLTKRSFRAAWLKVRAEDELLQAFLAVLRGIPDGLS